MDNTLFARTVLLLHDNHLLVIGVCLLVATMVAEVLRRHLNFPLITGYLLTGILVGPFTSNIVSSVELGQMALFSDIAIGVVVFELGRQLDWPWLRAEQRLMALALLESLAVFFAVYGTFSVAGLNTPTAGLLAIVAMTTSPIVLTAIIREFHAEGRVGDWAQVCTAVNNALAMCLAILLIPISRLAHGAPWEVALRSPLQELLGAICLGLAAGGVLTKSLHWLRRLGLHQTLPTLYLFGGILTTLGVAKALSLPPLLALLTLGITCRNLNHGKTVLGVNLDTLRNLFTCVLFVQVGAGLNFLAWRDATLWAVLFLLVRGTVRIVVPWLLAPFSGINHRQGALLGVALLPMSSLAVLTVQASTSALPEMDYQVAAITMAVLSVLELCGPFLTRWALRHAGETAVSEGVLAHG